jgi:wyosine [tRNA(Phe)-imidazoG37] synthetase (radical SAM superfamily)
MKLDAADPALLRRINAATVPVDQILDGLTRLRDIVVQAMFVRDRLGRIDNTSDLAVATWVSALSRIRPKAVQVYTIDREPAWPYLQAVSPARLEEIARRVRAAGIEAQAFLPGQAGVAAMAAGAL